jgi:predicted MFS family arabinose efflux permease
MIARAAGALLGPFHEVIAPSRGDGDPAYRARLLALLTTALALDYADRASLGALAPDLQHAFGIGNTGFGFLASAFGVVGAVATIPAGILTDRARRTVVLGGSMLLWTLAMGATGAAVSFAMLLAARIFLGAVTATARPMIASITGDVFHRGIRARALGLIDSGELIGNGAGFLLAGIVAALISWRAVFWLLGLLGAVAAVGVWRLREPPRSAGDEAVPPADGEAAAQLEQIDVEPDPALVLEGDQARLPLHEAVRYVLRIRTNVIVIVSVALASFFFSAVRVFGVLFIVRHYGVGRSLADLTLLVVGIGALAGMLAGGRIGDALIRGGRVNGRLVVSSWSYLVAAVAFVPTLFVDNVLYGLPPAILGAAALIAPTAPLDAVRLDIVHPQLWGRAEATRNVFQIGADATAPLFFGVLSDHLAGGGTSGMRVAYLASLALLLLGALGLQLARRTYPGDLVAAAAGAESTAGGALGGARG